jgi:hypothetical protein
VEAEGREATERAERLAAPPTEQAVGVVLDQCDVRTLGQRLADARHVARDAGVVHHHHGTDRRAVHGVGQQLGDVARVQAQGPGLDVAEEQPGPLPHEGERGGGEGEGRDDDGVARLEVEQHRGQLEGSRARRGEQHLRGPGLGLQELAHLPRVGAVG